MHSPPPPPPLPPTPPPRFLVVSRYSNFSFMCMLCRSLFVLRFFFFWSLCCLSFDLRNLINPCMWHPLCYSCYKPGDKPQMRGINILLNIFSRLLQKVCLLSGGFHESYVIRAPEFTSGCFVGSVFLIFKFFVLSYCVSLLFECQPQVVCMRAHVLFTLFVFVCVNLCPIHIVLCFCLCTLFC